MAMHQMDGKAVRGRGADKLVAQEVEELVTSETQTESTARTPVFPICNPLLPICNPICNCSPRVSPICNLSCGKDKRKSFSSRERLQIGKTLRTAIANRIANRQQRIANWGIRTLSRVCKLEAKYTKRENLSRRLAATANVRKHGWFLIAIIGEVLRSVKKHRITMIVAYFEASATKMKGGAKGQQIFPPAQGRALCRQAVGRLRRGLPLPGPEVLTASDGWQKPRFSARCVRTTNHLQGRNPH